MKLIADAIQRAGSADPEAVREALAQTKDLTTAPVLGVHTGPRAAALCDYADDTR